MAQEGSAIIVAMFALAFLVIAVVLLFVVFQRRKNILLLEQKEAKRRFEEEIVTSQIEIREETLRNISWELHDNIGQLITLAKIQLQNEADITEVKGTLNKGIEELRPFTLVKPDTLKNISLVEAAQQEVDRLNRINCIVAEMKITGEVIDIDPKVEIILFRIIQEFVSNTMKHAQADHLFLNFTFNGSSLELFIKDDGQGYDMDAVLYNGIGLSNIESRAKLIGAQVNN